MPDRLPFRLMVVDDNPSDVELLRYAFESAGSAEFTVCRDAEAAMSAWRRSPLHSFDAIIVDWRLPDLPGDQLVRRILDSEAASIPPVMILSSISAEHAGADLQSRGVAFAEKPMDLDAYGALAERIGRLAGRAQSHAT